MNPHKDVEDGSSPKETLRRKKGGPRKPPRRLQHFGDMLHGWKYRPVEGGQLQPATGASIVFEDELDFRTATEDIDSSSNQASTSDVPFPDSDHETRLQSNVASPPSPRLKPLDNASRIPSYELLSDLFSSTKTPSENSTDIQPFGQTDSLPEPVYSYQNANSEIVNSSYGNSGSQLEVPSNFGVRRALPRTIGREPQPYYRSNFSRSASFPSRTARATRSQYDIGSFHSDPRISKISFSDFPTIASSPTRYNTNFGVRDDGLARPFQHSWDNTGVPYLSVPPNSPFPSLGEYSPGASHHSYSLGSAFSDPSAPTATYGFPLQGDTHIATAPASTMEGSMTSPPCITLSGPDYDNSGRLSPLQDFTRFPPFDSAVSPSLIGEESVESSPCVTLSVPSDTDTGKLSPLQGLTYLPPFDSVPSPSQPTSSLAPSPSAVHQYRSNLPSPNSLAPILEAAPYVPASLPAARGSLPSPSVNVAEWHVDIAGQQDQISSAMNPFDGSKRARSMDEFSFASNVPHYSPASGSATSPFLYDSTSSMPMSSPLAQHGEFGQSEGMSFNTDHLDDEVFFIDDPVQWNSNGGRELELPYQNHSYAHVSDPKFS